MKIKNIYDGYHVIVVKLENANTARKFVSFLNKNGFRVGSFMNTNSLLEDYDHGFDYVAFLRMFKDDKRVMSVSKSVLQGCDVKIISIYHIEEFININPQDIFINEA